MSVEKTLCYGSPNVGVYAVATEEFALIASEAPEKFEETVEEALGVKAVRVTINRSQLVGVFAVANSKGILLTSFTTEEEVEAIKRIFEGEIEIGVINARESAIGNLILTTDKAALVSPLLPRNEMKKVEDVLGVEAVVRDLAGSPLVGSFAVATNRGVLACPLVSESELDELEEIFEVPADVGTVNRGSVFIRAGVIANSKGAVVGYDTTGPELLRIHRVLFS